MRTTVHQRTDFSFLARSIRRHEISTAAGLFLDTFARTDALDLARAALQSPAWQTFRPYRLCDGELVAELGAAVLCSEIGITAERN